MLRFRDRKIAEETFYVAKKPSKIWNVKVAWRVITKLFFFMD